MQLDYETMTNISPATSHEMQTMETAYHVDTHLTLANSSSYSQTRIIINMDTHPTSIHALESTCPDRFKDTLEYVCKFGIFITDLPLFHNERTFFVFYLLNRETQEYKEWIRFVGADGNSKDICFGNLFLEYKEAMDVLSANSRIVMIHGSHDRKIKEAVNLSTTIAYKG